jgi:transposase-like protein
MLIDELPTAQRANRRLSSLNSAKLDGLVVNQSAELRRLREENDELREVNQQLSKQNQELKAQSSLVAALERQIYRLTKEKNLLMKKIMLLNEGQANES